MGSVLGILSKAGPDTKFMYKSLHNTVFNTHNFSRGNSVTRRLSGYVRSPSIRYHPSRATIKY